jgi:hypothetical protein
VDAYITAEALQILEALDALNPRRRRSGVLIGHKRGRRFIVERILPAPANFDPKPAVLGRLDEIFAGKAVGFFSSGDLTRTRAGLRQPLAAGRLLLATESRRRARRVKAWAVDFDGRFRFIPIPVILEGEHP